MDTTGALTTNQYWHSQAITDSMSADKSLVARAARLREIYDEMPGTDQRSKAATNLPLG